MESRDKRIDLLRSIERYQRLGHPVRIDFDAPVEELEITLLQVQTAYEKDREDRIVTDFITSADYLKDMITRDFDPQQKTLIDLVWDVALASSLESGNEESVFCDLCSEDILLGARRLRCGHSFHSKCVFGLDECPTCRKDLRYNSEYVINRYDTGWC